MLLAGAILDQGVWILIDTDATHNDIDSSITHINGLTECRINTTVLIGSDMELANWGACFTIPLRINCETFQIDAFLLPISDHINVILGAPWMIEVSNAH